jgi:signal peptidase I
VIDEPVELPAPTAKKKHRTRRQIIEWSIVIGAAFLTAIILRVGVVQAFSIPSVSMERTLLVGDRVLVNKLSARGHTPHHGDVVVFKRPPHEEAAAIKDLIKRVIGLPGDTVSAEDGALYLNGKRLREPYLEPGTRTVIDSAVTVPAGKVFVMGDNRTQSRDSRFFGPITIKSIIGKAFIRVWPPNRIGRI